MWWLSIWSKEHCIFSHCICPQYFEIKNHVPFIFRTICFSERYLCVLYDWSTGAHSVKWKDHGETTAMGKQVQVFCSLKRLLSTPCYCKFANVNTSTQFMLRLENCEQLPWLPFHVLKTSFKQVFANFFLHTGPMFRYWRMLLYTVGMKNWP